MDYVTALIALAATCLGVCGETSTKKARGFRKITRVGYAALTLAILACAVTLVQIRHAQVMETARQVEGVESISYAIEEIISSVYWAKTNQTLIGLEKSRTHLIQRLQQLGLRINRLIALYHEVLPDEVRRAGFSISVVTTESAEKAGDRYYAKDYLNELDQLIDKAAVSISRPGFTYYRPFPLSDFAFDFDNPNPDPP